MARLAGALHRRDRVPRPDGAAINVFAYKCNEELNMALEYEGEESVYYAFELLGEIAMTELMQDQGVSAASELFIDYVDLSIFEQILNY